MLGAEGGDRERHQRRGGGLEGREPQAAAAQPGDRLQLGLSLGQAGEDRVGVADQRLAGLRQPDPARVALDERAAGFALERGDLLRDGGLREGEGLGRGAENEPRTATSRSTRMRRTSSISRTYTTARKRSFELMAGNAPKSISRPNHRLR